jgi:DegV family protein with EDD domain
MDARRLFSVITDSTADIAPQIAAEKGITVVPLSVSFGAETFLDGEISQADFFKRMSAAPQLPTTSQPPMGAFVEAYEKALETAEQVISVHISEKLSGTIESARQAAEQFAGRVHVFDSRNLSWGLALQAIEAASAAAQGLTVDATLERLENVRQRVRLIVGLDSLDNLSRGGRIGKVSAFLGAMLDLKVTLTVDSDGAFVPVARSRGEKAALKHTLDWVAKQMGAAKRGSFAVGHAMEESRARALAAALEGTYEVDEMVVYEAGVVICTHTGTGWGVAVLPAE